MVFLKAGSTEVYRGYTKNFNYRKGNSLMKRGIVSIIFLITLFFTTEICASELYITKGGWFGAINKECFALPAEQIDDIVAVQEMIDNGTIFIMDEGVEVYIENDDRDIVVLRRRGETSTFWTFASAIEKE